MRGAAQARAEGHVAKAASPPSRLAIRAERRHASRSQVSKSACIKQRTPRTSSCAACGILSVLTQWGATLVIKLKGGDISSPDLLRYRF